MKMECIVNADTARNSWKSIDRKYCFIRLPNDVYFITIENTENGIIEFAGLSGLEKKLYSGDDVNIDMYPDDGYQVSDFFIKDSETG